MVLLTEFSLCKAHHETNRQTARHACLVFSWFLDLLKDDRNAVSQFLDGQ